MASHVGEYKLRAVEHLEHYDIALLHPCLDECVAQTVDLLINLRVSPAMVCKRVNECLLARETAHIAHEALYPCVAAFKYFLKALHIFYI